MLTGIRNDDIQPIGKLLDFFHSLLVALLVIRSQLDDMYVAVLAGDLVESRGRRWVTSTGKDDGLRVALDESVDEIVSDTSVRTRDYMSQGEFWLNLLLEWTYRE